MVLTRVNNTCCREVNFFKLDAQMCLKSHIPLGREKKEGGNVHACRDMTLHFFPPEMSMKILSTIRCPAGKAYKDNLTDNK